MRRLMRFESVTDPRASEIDMSPSRRSAPATIINFRPAMSNRVRGFCISARHGQAQPAVAQNTGIRAMWFKLGSSTFGCRLQRQARGNPINYQEAICL